MTTRAFKMLALSVCMAASVSTVHADQIKVATNDWVPYNTVDGKGLVDIVVKEALGLVGHEVVYVVQPWKRAYESVKAGENDLTYPWNYTEEKAAEIKYNDGTLVSNRTMFWYKKGTDFSWNSFDDLKKYRIGGIIGYSDVDTLEGQGVEVQKAKDEITNLKKLLGGRIDVFPMNESVGKQVIKESLTPEQSAQLEMYSAKPLLEMKMNAIFTDSEQGKKYAADFDRGLNMLKESGRYQEILSSDQ